MSWRPKDWQTEKPRWRGGILGWIYDGFDDGVEAGADAILEALRKHYTLGYCAVQGLGFGWQVLIPDKKDNG